MRMALANRSSACRAIIFDKDGTLVDLYEVDIQLGRSRYTAIAELLGPEAALAWQRAVGFDMAAGSFDRDGPLILAPRQDEMLVAAGALYLLGHPWEEARDLTRRAYDRADELLRSPFGGRLFPGVAELLAELRARGLLLAIATSDRRWRSQAALTDLGVAGCFTAIVGAEDVANGKPAPDMVYLACERLGCRPVEAIVVGDSPIDLRMGRAAGVAACIGVTTGLNGPDRLAPLADLVLPSVVDLARHLQ